jgi:hypothetical protein
MQVQVDTLRGQLRHECSDVRKRATEPVDAPGGIDVQAPPRCAPAQPVARWHGYRAAQERGRRRLANGKAARYTSASGISARCDVSPSEARACIGRVANDAQYTLEAQKLEEMSDEEVFRLYDSRAGSSERTMTPGRRSDARIFELGILHPKDLELEAIAQVGRTWMANSLQSFRCRVDEPTWNMESNVALEREADEFCRPVKTVRGRSVWSNALLTPQAIYSSFFTSATARWGL